MRAFLIRRAIATLAVLGAVSLLLFALVQLLPGDIAQTILGQFATPTDVAVLRAKYGLDQPLVQRYWDWLTGFITGHWGTSPIMGVPIQPLILDRLRNSALLALITLIIVTPLSICLGVLSAVYRGRLADRLTSAVTLSGMAVPEFVSGIFLTIIFSEWLGLLPATSFLGPGQTPLNTPKVLVLPAMTLTVVLLAYVTRMTRYSMITSLNSPYVRTAELKGLSATRVVVKHALRTALLPTVTVLANQVGWLLGGLVIVESLFSYPGVGLLLYNALLNKDLFLLETVGMIIAAVYIGANFLADIIYALLNPLIRYN